MVISRTVRYVKLVYIVAGILVSNEKICETVDQIQLAPNVPEVRELLHPQKVYTTVGNISSSWLRRIYLYGLRLIKRSLAQVTPTFSIWSIPNYLLDYTTSYISRKCLLSSDCDVIYNK